MTLKVESEVGRLRRVLVHRPGREIDRMLPSTMEKLLFEDILDGDQARREHRSFCAVFEAAGVEVVQAERLLADVLTEGSVRDHLLEELEIEYGVHDYVLDELRDCSGTDMAAALIGGMRFSSKRGGRRRRTFFDLDPVSNYFFQRDPQVVLRDVILTSSMATEAREREALLSRLIFAHHPELQGHRAHFSVDRPHAGAEDFDPTCLYPSLEGGDVLVVSPEIVLVGISERTNRWGVEALADRLLHHDTGFRHLVVVSLPTKRSYMHLDTVFTFVDTKSALAYLPVIEPGGTESAHVYHVDLESPELAFVLRPSLTGVLAELGHDIELIPCGGRGDILHQQREQWTDGANAFAIAPGLILLYERNRRTVEELVGRGWRVLGEDEAAEAGDLLEGGPTVVTLRGYELSRARGGPRCMTMPLLRDSLPA